MRLGKTGGTKVTAFVAAASAALFTGQVSAVQVMQGSASLSLGQYDLSGALDLEADGTILGGDLGFSYATGGENGLTVFAGEIEFMSTGSIDGSIRNPNTGQRQDISDSEFDRTDAKVTAGYQFPNRITPFVGARLAWQGDGFFNDDSYKETGYFLGASLSGMKVGEAGAFAVSLAYNDSTLDTAGGELEVDGLSARVAFNLAKSPVGFSLKYQEFSDDNDFFKEQYLLASVTYYFYRQAKR